MPILEAKFCLCAKPFLFPSLEARVQVNWISFKKKILTEGSKYVNYILKIFYIKKMIEKPFHVSLFMAKNIYFIFKQSKLYQTEEKDSPLILVTLRTISQKCK